MICLISVFSRYFRHPYRFSNGIEFFCDPTPSDTCQRIIGYSFFRPVSNRNRLPFRYATQNNTHGYTAVCAVILWAIILSATLHMSIYTWYDGTKRGSHRQIISAHVFFERYSGTRESSKPALRLQPRLQSGSAASVKQHNCIVYSCIKWTIELDYSSFSAILPSSKHDNHIHTAITYHT